VQEMHIKPSENNNLRLFSLPQYQSGNLQRRFRPNGVTLRNYEMQIKEEDSVKKQPTNYHTSASGLCPGFDKETNVANSMVMFIRSPI